MQATTIDEIQFHPVSMQDSEWMIPALKHGNSRSSSGCFGTHLLWGHAYGELVANYKGMLLTKYEIDGKPHFACPSGSGNTAEAMRVLEELAGRENSPLLLYVTELQRDRIETVLPGRFHFEEDRDGADYLYTVEKLSTLAGKKLQSKRNHCNRFEKENSDWHFEPMTLQNLQECRLLLDRWSENRTEEQNSLEGLEQERKTILLAFENFDKLDMMGGCLYVGDRLAAFTLGEMTGGNTIDVHFEKADTEIEGSFAMINREFARMIAQKYPSVQYLNREEDMGIEALRKAKESYRPDLMLSKYVVTEK